jgi:hypothetical protein
VTWYKAFDVASGCGLKQLQSWMRLGAPRSHENVVSIGEGVVLSQVSSAAADETLMG